jgi:hypothetical protein
MTTSNVLKFPFDVARRAHARKPRRSKNGTPAERAAKAAGSVDLARVRIERQVDRTARFMAIYNQLGPAEQAIIQARLKTMMADR